MSLFEMVRILFLVGFVFGSPVYAQGMFSNADWVALATDVRTDTETGEQIRAEYYVKQSTISVTGDNQYRIELLANFTPALVGDGSFVMNMEVNCDNLYTRPLKLTTYSKHFLRGKQNFSDALDGKWGPPVSGDAGWNAAFNKLCGP